MKQAIFVIPVLVLAACGNKAPIQKGDAPLREKEVFQDVPAPPNLTYDAGIGRSNPSGSIRSYTQDYSGRARPEDVTKFFRDTLPQHGWTAAGEEGSGPWKMKFTKREEQCVVDVASTSDGVKVKVKLDYKQ